MSRLSDEANRQPIRGIPTFATIEEEAAFWDTHDSTEFEDLFEDAPGVRFVPARTSAPAVSTSDGEPGQRR